MSNEDLPQRLKKLEKARNELLRQISVSEEILEAIDAGLEIVQEHADDRVQRIAERQSDKLPLPMNEG